MENRIKKIEARLEKAKANGNTEAVKRIKERLANVNANLKKKVNIKKK